MVFQVGSLYGGRVEDASKHISGGMHGPEGVSEGRQFLWICPLDGSALPICIAVIDGAEETGGRWRSLPDRYPLGVLPQFQAEDDIRYPQDRPLRIQIGGARGLDRHGPRDHRIGHNPAVIAPGRRRVKDRYLVGLVRLDVIVAPQLQATPDLAHQVIRIAGVADTVRILVSLIGIGNERTIVTGIAYPILIGIALLAGAFSTSDRTNHQIAVTIRIQDVSIRNVGTFITCIADAVSVCIRLGYIRHVDTIVAGIAPPILI
ncbi:MAG TPA: hypothetical protein PLM77_18860 [Phycisphaerae bacterium]|nr:hypothetical protein [Phycisphaerae bacterium]HQE45252.1 hypothetical protein [Phycisphaerae bacterium]